jgi:hypothetical protein
MREFDYRLDEEQRAFLIKRNILKEGYNKWHPEQI